MPNDELLRAKILGSLLTPIPNIPKRIEMANKLTDEILAEVKAMGYKSPEEVKEAIQDEIDGLVESGML